MRSALLIAAFLSVLACSTALRAVATPPVYPTELNMDMNAGDFEDDPPRGSDLTYRFSQNLKLELFYCESPQCMQVNGVSYIYLLDYIDNVFIDAALVNNQWVCTNLTLDNKLKSPLHLSTHALANVSVDSAHPPTNKYQAQLYQWSQCSQSGVVCDVWVGPKDDDGYSEVFWIDRNTQLPAAKFVVPTTGGTPYEYFNTIKFPKKFVFSDFWLPQLQSCQYQSREARAEMIAALA